MRILFLTSEFPFPPTNGVRIKSYNLLKGLLEKGHEIHLMSFYTSEVEGDFREGEDLIRCCKSISIVQLPRARSQLVKNAIRSFYKKDVILTRFKSKGFTEKLINIVKNEPIDLVHFDMVSSTFYADLLDGVMPIVASINDSYSLWLRDKLMKRPSPNWSSVKERIYYTVTFPVATAYEKHNYEKFQKVHVVSEIDARYLGHLNPRLDLNVIPNGIDTGFFRPLRSSEDQASLAFVANMKGDVAQNVIWFIRKVFNQVKQDVPDVKLYLIGKNIDPMIYSEARRMKDIIIAGRVKDIRPYVDRATLVIDPTKKRGGILNHVLQAMAMEKTVVGTPFSFLAINEAKSWNNVVVAKDAKEFATNIKYLLANENRRTTIGRNARKLIEANYTWDNIISRYERMYTDAIKKFQQKQIV
jgi:glycosyltransferase involved in cell wall biosynthesis